MLWVENDSPMSFGVYRMKINIKSRILMIIKGEKPKRNKKELERCTLSTTNNRKNVTDL